MAAGSSLPILVVDDHRTMLAIIAKQLRDIGFPEVDTVGDPITALTMLRRRRYRLILSDWNMTPMDGLAFLRAVRSDPDYAAIPFVLITAESRPEAVAEAGRLGVDGFILKPFDSASLKARLTGLLGRV
ncbi:response regulator [Ferrovibrio sp.]|jgi:two-component system chemotaxis response regulator CheY|uniref:response regulator n=1 Tax=Ferrovibrio sp. TaxID=1917215 RepID=UPI0035B3A484